MPETLDESIDSFNTKANRIADERNELLKVVREFVRVMELPSTTCSMPNTVAMAKRAIRKCDG